MKTATKQSFSSWQQQSTAMSCCLDGTKFTQAKTNSNLVLQSSINKTPLIIALLLVAIILVNLIIL